MLSSRDAKASTQVCHRLLMSKANRINVLMIEGCPECARSGHPIPESGAHKADG